MTSDGASVGMTWKSSESIILDAAMAIKAPMAVPARYITTPSCSTMRNRFSVVAPSATRTANSLPRWFTAYASTLPGGLDRALAVVVGNGQEAEQMASQLGEAARVVVEQPGGPIATAFAVSGFPTVFALDAEGAISAAGFTLDKLPVLAEA